MLQRRQHTHSRGTALVYFIATLPIALIVMLATLTRSEIALREAQREQFRAQAQLLAESALLLAESGQASSLARMFPDYGECRLEIGQGGRLSAVGKVHHRELEYGCRIEAESTGAVIRVLAKTTSVRLHDPAI